VSNAPSCSLGERLLGTPNEEMWPGVGKLPNWHVYPQWKPTKLSTLVPGLDSDGYDLLEVSEKYATHLSSRICSYGLLF
jgi:hypothetical protein